MDKNPHNSSSVRILAVFLGLCCFSQGNLRAMDRDNDGMSDVWQRQHGIMIGDRDSDPDNDDYPNWVEDAFGSSPVAGHGQPGDAMAGMGALATDTVLGGEMIATIAVPVLPGLVYQVEGRTGGQEPPAAWEAIGAPVQGGSSPEILNVPDLGHPLAAGTCREYRVLAQRHNSPDADGDGLDAYEEWLLGTSDLAADSDGDGSADGDEFEAETNPGDAQSAPENGWIMLSGDLAQDQPKILNRTLRVPAGQSAILVLMVASEEYPVWTDPESAPDFNDLLGWNIIPSVGPPMDGGIDVNSRHESWQQAQAQGLSFRGHDPAYTEFTETLTAPRSSDIAVNVNLSAINIGDGALPSTIIVGLLPFRIETASIREGLFRVQIPNLHEAALGTLDLILRRQGSSSGDVVLRTLFDQSPGIVAIQLDDSMNQDPSPLDGLDTLRFDRVRVRWRIGGADYICADKVLDVPAVEVLARRRISNYFSPTWGGNWQGGEFVKGVFPAGDFPNGLYNANLRGEFLDSLDPVNQGLAMDNNTVIRTRLRDPVPGFLRHTSEGGNLIPNDTDTAYGPAGYICFPDVDQRNTATGSTVQLLRDTSVAVRTNADRLNYRTADEVYVPGFSIRTADDSGGLHGNVDQIDVWRGQGDRNLRNLVFDYGVQRRTCLKLIRP